MAGYVRGSGDRDKSERTGISSVSGVFVFGSVLFVLGAVAYLALRQNWIGPILAHAGAFGLTIVLAGLVALIAGKKGYVYGRALTYGVSLPMLIGLIAVAFFYVRQGVFYCGGSVVLGVSLLLIIVASLLPRKVTARQ